MMKETLADRHARGLTLATIRIHAPLPVSPSRFAPRDYRRLKKLGGRAKTFGHHDSRSLHVGLCPSTPPLAALCITGTSRDKRRRNQESFHYTSAHSTSRVFGSKHKTNAFDDGTHELTFGNGWINRFLHIMIHIRYDHHDRGRSETRFFGRGRRQSREVDIKDSGAGVMGS